jgi:hypothetical protein
MFLFVVLASAILFTTDATHETGTSGGVNFNYLTGMPTALAKPPEPGTSLPDYENSGATPQYPMYFDAAASVDYIKQIEKGALIRAKELIDTDTYTSLNDMQWELAQEATKGASNYGHLADAYSHLFLWPQRFEPGWAGSEGILAARIDVPHKWAYPSTCPNPGVEDLLPPSPYKQLPYEQGRCDIFLPQGTSTLFLVLSCIVCWQPFWYESLTDCCCKLLFFVFLHHSCAICVWGRCLFSKYRQCEKIDR